MSYWCFDALADVKSSRSCVRQGSAEHAIATPNQMSDRDDDKGTVV